LLVVDNNFVALGVTDFFCRGIALCRGIAARNFNALVGILANKRTHDKTCARYSVI
jgi:hypothetical protein